MLQLLCTSHWLTSAGHTLHLGQLGDRLALQAHLAALYAVLYDIVGLLPCERLLGDLVVHSGALQPGLDLKLTFKTRAHCS